ncbi:MAG: hypothetical protein K1W24_01025 [Lachnospiraceae bacterium]
MRTGHDIECEAPVSEELLYNIREYLVPLVTRYGNNLHYVNITAETVPEPLENAGMVGASASCGVDSFNTIVNQYDSQYKSMNITHLCLNNVGAFNSCYGDCEKQNLVKKERYKKAKELSCEIGLPVILTESNFGELFPQSHLFTNTYSSVFSILCMRKAWKIYYYSSCHSIALFSLLNNETKDSSFYDLLSLNCFSTDGLHIYSEGGEQNRLEKIYNIASSSYAKKYLHVCIREAYNCGICDKCTRTLLCLDIAEKLEEFSGVFDIDYYKKHKEEYLEWLYYKYLDKAYEYSYLYDKMEKDPLWKKIINEFPDKYNKTKQLLETGRIILYGCGSFGQKIESNYSKNIEIKIDNKIKGNQIITFREFQNKFQYKEEDNYICVIASLSKYRQFREQVLKYYPGLEVLNTYIVKEIVGKI